MSSSSRYRLTMRKGPLPGKVYDLAKSLLTIGREVKNDIVINDAEVSRQHLRFTEQAGGYSVEDLASTNGSFINGQRLSGPTALRPGDVIGLGGTVELEYLVQRDPEATVLAGQSGGPVMPEPAPADQPAAIPAFTPPPPSAPPSFSAPPPPAPVSFSAPAAPAPSGGFQMQPWMWAVGIGCGLVVVCACVVGVALVILGPTFGQIFN